MNGVLTVRDNKYMYNEPVYIYILCVLYVYVCIHSMYTYVKICEYTFICVCVYIWFRSSDSG